MRLLNVTANANTRNRTLPSFRKQIRECEPKTRHKLWVGAGHFSLMCDLWLITFRWSLTSNWSLFTDPWPLIGHFSLIPDYYLVTFHWSLASDWLTLTRSAPGARTAPCVSRSLRGAPCLQTTPAQPAGRTRPTSSSPTPSFHETCSEKIHLYSICLQYFK